MDIDAAALAAISLPEQPLGHYLDVARNHRPELAMLRMGLRAAKANVEVQRANLLPDIALVGSIFGLAKTTENDEAASPYMNHPFASHGYGGGLYLKWGLDLHLKMPRYARAQAEYDAAIAAGAAAEDGMTLEIQSAHATLVEATAKMGILKKGERAARSWLTAVAQNFAIGTAEASEFTDALVAYFEAHGRYLQAIYDYNMAVAQLGRAIGVDLGAGTPPAE
jgi:outer membrane protein TolC